MPTPTASSSTPNARTPGAIATGSSSALNADLPYDRFLTLQLAGDDIAARRSDALIATGFCRCGPREVVGGNVIPEVKRQSELSEITGTVGSVFLGLTIGCARCHDHKFDAIPTTDYYRLQAFFAASELDDLPIASESERERLRGDREGDPREDRTSQEQLAKLEAPYRQAIKARKVSMLSTEERAVMDTPEKKRTPAQKKLAQGLQTSLRVTWEEVAAAVAADPAVHARRESLKRAIYEIERTAPAPARARDGAGRPEIQGRRHVRPPARGLQEPGPKVAPRPPGVILAAQPAEAFTASLDRPGRREDRPPAGPGAWLARPDNPLTARVIVNRLWQYHFGRGIVADAERLRRPRRAPDPPRAARLAGRPS